MNKKNPDHEPPTRTVEQYEGDKAAGINPVGKPEYGSKKGMDDA